VDFHQTVVVPETNVTEGGHRRVTALNFREAGIILHPLAAIADNPPMVYDNAGVSVRPLPPARTNDDISGRSLTHGDLVKSFVMRQRGPENGGAKDMFRWRPEHDSLIGSLCEDEGYGQRIFRKAFGWTPRVLGGHANALNRRLGNLHTLDPLQFFFSRGCAHPLTKARMATRADWPG